ncbi:MAG: 5'/3'-nucleotidase SurE [Dysgonamonadaceae bacterium]|jgi:5'-nucleotidase|nr:5'/3'-nucleotidase SurE [Dysgonamonadaceae bacterium]
MIHEKEKKPLILVSNDDGFEAKGINELIKAVMPLGDIVVVAPDGPRSGMSSAITSIEPLKIKLLENRPGLTVYSCTGTPVDCIKLGIDQLLDRRPDLVVTGINHGSNASICVLYSGTMGAAIEGCIIGIPSVGFSLTDHRQDADFRNAAHYANLISKKILEEGLPRGVCLNVNVPNADNIKGVKICCQTDGQWIKEFYTSEENGETQYWLTGEFDNFEPDNRDSDEWALANGYVSVVPTKVDMTAHEMIDKLKHWELK